MRKTKKINPEPYEDMLRLEKLDPYEAQIKSNRLLNKCKKNIN